MDVDVFDIFDLTSYTFNKISRGGITGNVIEASYEATGVLKRKSNLITNDNSENKESDTTLHIRPDESFLSELNYNVIGHSIVSDGVSYEITGQTTGKNFHTGTIEHYRLTLQESEMVES